MAIDKGLSKTELSSQTIDNYDFDKTYGISRKAQYEYDPITDSFVAKKTSGAVFATKVTTIGDVTYVAKAAPGTAQATAKWQAQKIDSSVSGTTVITWADEGKFSQVAKDLTNLSYS